MPLETPEKPDAATKAGAAIYTSFILSYVYDFWVLGISNSYIWRCSTRDVLLPFFQANLGRDHLDIGVGTGYYLNAANPPSESTVTLVDLSENSLAAAKARLDRQSNTKCIVHDIFKPLPTEEKYDSISLMYLLHCMPGPPARKAAIFKHLKDRLAPGGVLFGATILGQGVKHNWAGRVLMSTYNRKGYFSNYPDAEEDFVSELRANFEDVEAWMENMVLLFKARNPRK